MTALNVIGIGLAVVFAVGFGVWRLARRTGFFLHLLQLDGYKRHEYTSWIVTNRRGLVLRVSHVLAAVVLSVGTVLLYSGFSVAAVIVVLVCWPVVFASSRRYRRAATKKPFVFTARTKRLIAASTVVSMAVVLIPIAVATVAKGGSVPPSTASSVLLVIAGLGLADFLAPLSVWLAALVMEPIEKNIQEGFKSQARQKLAARPDLLVIGITGSYGKTSTKAAIAAVLGHRRSVLASPGSFNTPMGICKVVNNMLRRDHQVLILEMGARYAGDIQELCELASPKMGIITNVGVAHLETMGSVAGIAKEKGTLAEAIPPTGTVVLNHDDPLVLAMKSRTRAHVLTVGTSTGADIRGENISFGPDGSSFDVVDDTGERGSFRTDVLGHHNVMNILFAVAVGRSQGMRLREMAHAVAAMPAVEHRLKLRREGEVYVLDDAFNSNPVGARNAIDILNSFKSGKRIVVTPGMVELGPSQDDENRAFGSYMADKADLVLLVGKTQTTPILEGLLKAGFAADNALVFPSLSSARDHLRTVLRPGDIVLYENDLPDHYEEAA